MIVFDLYDIKDYQPAFLLATIGIIIGLVTLGERVMHTIGKQVIHLDLPKAICAQFAVGISSTVGSILGLPLSTSHCILGALIGVSAAQYIGKVHEIYSHLGEEKKKVNLLTICKVVIWCLVTIPLSMFISYSVCSLVI